MYTVFRPRQSKLQQMAQELQSVESVMPKQLWQGRCCLQDLESEARQSCSLSSTVMQRWQPRRRRSAAVVPAPVGLCHSYRFHGAPFGRQFLRVESVKCSAHSGFRTL